MKKIFYYATFTLIISILFSTNVFAECSYQERKDLLTESNNISINIEPIVEIEETTGNTSYGENEKIIIEKHSFKFSISNITENLFIKYYNDILNETYYVGYEDLKEGIYEFVDNNYYDINNYYFEIYSTNENCPGKLIEKKEIIKPKFNTFSKYEICEKKELNDLEYCKKYLTKELNITESEFFEKTKNEVEYNFQPKEDNNKFNIFKYWYILIIIIIMALCLKSIKLKRKRGKK